MNTSRECYLVTCTLPYDVTMTFGKSGAPAENLLRPIFRKLGSTKCLARRLPVKHWSPKQVTITLPEELACHGEGRYELLLHDKCCRECDKVEIWFEADCEIIDVRGEQVDEYCEDCL